MKADAMSISLCALFEIVALIVIVRMWMRRRVKLFPRLLWSAVLLVPLFGLLVYALLHEEPAPHPYRTGDGGWNVGIDGHGDGGGGHGGH
jgi:hypothetical protein